MFTRELSMIIMCGGVMTLTVCVLVVLWKLGNELLLKVWFLIVWFLLCNTKP